MLALTASLKWSHERGPHVIPIIEVGRLRLRERKAPQRRGSRMRTLAPDFATPGCLLAPQIRSFSFVPCTALCAVAIQKMLVVGIPWQSSG